MKKLRKNDQVIVISGSSKGKMGRIVKLDWKNNKVVVEKVNMVKKHLKPSQMNPDGGIQEREAPINISNVMLVVGKNKQTKVGIKKEGKKKVRFSKKTKKTI